MKSFSQAGVLLLVLSLLVLGGCACQPPRPDYDPTYLLNYAVKVSVSYELAASAAPASATPDASSPPDARPSPGVTRTVSGSGSVFSSNSTRSLVLTAAHVCGEDDGKKEVTVQRVSGPEVPARIIWKDLDQDLCVLAVDGGLPGTGASATQATGSSGAERARAGSAVAPVASSLPPIGSSVYYPGAPIGIFGEGVGFLGQGNYAGRASVSGTKRVLVSGTSTNGASGSGIFFRGRLIGVLLAVATESGYIVIGADLEAVRVAITAGLAAAETQSSCARIY